MNNSVKVDGGMEWENSVPPGLPPELPQTKRRIPLTPVQPVNVELKESLDLSQKKGKRRRWDDDDGASVSSASSMGRFSTSKKARRKKRTDVENEDEDESSFSEGSSEDEDEEGCQELRTSLEHAMKQVMQRGLNRMTDFDVIGNLVSVRVAETIEELESRPNRRWFIQFFKQFEQEVHLELSAYKKKNLSFLGFYNHSRFLDKTLGERRVSLVQLDKELMTVTKQLEAIEDEKKRIEHYLQTLNASMRYLSRLGNK